MPVALTIAGSDPSGGAGIQADLRTFQALGVTGISVITALTVQNSQGVQSVHPVAPDILAAQLECILSDTRPDAVKIGMLGGAAQVRVVADAVRRHKLTNVVLDPVLAASNGVPLLDEAGRAALLQDLMPLCDLITPNLAESALLTGLLVDSIEGMKAAGKALMQRGAKAVLVKGGHLNGEPIDYLLSEEAGIRDGIDTGKFSGYRVNTAHTHGTGCCLSSAIAASLALQRSLYSAIFRAKESLSLALEVPIVIGQGRGYPDMSHTQYGRQRLRHQENLARIQGVYVVTDSKINLSRSHADIAKAARQGGASVVQLRAEGLEYKEYRQLTREMGLVLFLSEKPSLLIVNDRVDVAMASGADGVHLGPEDMSPKDARRVMGLDKIIGVSVGTLEEAKAAAPYASYFGVGAIYGSKTKLDAGKPIGVDPIREIKAAFPNIPLVAIGGINLTNIAEIAAAGADAAAVVSAVVMADDMAEAVRELNLRFAEGKAEAARAKAVAEAGQSDGTKKQ